MIKIKSKLLSIDIDSKSWALLKKDNKIIGKLINKLFVIACFLFWPKTKKAVMQLPDLLKPGKKARHWNIPAIKKSIDGDLVLIWIFLNLSAANKIIAPMMEVYAIIFKDRKLKFKIFMISPIISAGINEIAISLKLSEIRFFKPKEECFNK